MGKFKIIDPAEEYRKMMGDEAFDRQRKLADLEAGRCVCNRPKVKRHWQGGDKLTTRTVHDVYCPKYKTWMEERFT